MAHSTLFNVTRPSQCTFDPTLVEGPIGMFHCPMCGGMQIAGVPHIIDDVLEEQYGTIPTLEAGAVEPRDSSD